MTDEESYNNMYFKIRLAEIRPFINSIIMRSMSWTDEDTVMEIGCDLGVMTCMILIDAIPKYRILLAIDASDQKINAAKRFFSSKQICYRVADIENRNTIPTDLFGTIPKAISIHQFQWVFKQRVAFENLHALLTPGGEAGLLLVLTTPFWDACLLAAKNPLYACYLENPEHYVPESHTQGWRSRDYKMMLTEIGFEVLVCEEEKGTSDYRIGGRSKGSIRTGYGRLRCEISSVGSNADLLRPKQINRYLSSVAEDDDEPFSDSEQPIPKKKKRTRRPLSLCELSMRWRIQETMEGTYKPDYTRFTEEDMAIEKTFDEIVQKCIEITKRTGREYPWESDDEEYVNEKDDEEEDEEEEEESQSACDTNNVDDEVKNNGTNSTEMESVSNNVEDEVKKDRTGSEETESVSNNVEDEVKKDRPGSAEMESVSKNN